MTSKDKMLLDSHWWTKQQPDALKAKSGKAFFRALVEYEQAVRAFEKDETEDTAQTVQRKIDAVRAAGRSVRTQAETELRKAGRAGAPDAEALRNTATAMQRPLTDALRTAEEALATAGGAEDLSAELEAYKATLSADVMRLKKRSMSFAFVLTGTAPQDIRIVFDRKAGGQKLERGLKQEFKRGKFTFGRAHMTLDAETAEAVGQDTPGTLWLRIEGKDVANIAPRLKKHFRYLGLKKIKAVELLAFDTSYSKLKDALDAKHDAALAAHPEHDTALMAIWREAEAFEENNQLGQATAVLRDKLVPLLRSLKTGDAAQDSAALDPAAGAPADRKDRLNKTLTKVLDHTFDPKAPTRIQQAFGAREKAPVAPKTFFDATKVTFPKASKLSEQGRSLTRDWAINMAMLQHLGADLPADSPELQALRNRQLAYLLKFANLDKSAAFRFQTNPIQSELSGGAYHRQGGTELTRQAHAMVADKIGVPTERMMLVSTPRALEEVRRQMAFADEYSCEDGWTDLDCDRVVTQALALNGKAADGEELTFVDATAALKSALAEGKTIHEAVGEIATKIEARARGNALSLNGMSEAEYEQLSHAGELDAAQTARLDAVNKSLALAEHKLSYVRIGGTVMVKDQPAIVIYPYGDAHPPAPEEPAAEKAPKGRRWLPKFGRTGFTMAEFDAIAAWSPPVTKALELGEMANHGGFTAGPNQLLDTMLSLEPNPVEVLKALGVTGLPKVTFPEMRLQPFDAFETDFLQDETVDAFRQLSAAGPNDPEPPAFVRVNVDAMMSLIRGLETDTHSVKRKLDDAGLGQLWTLAMNKIHALMAEVVQLAGADPVSMKAFVNCIALIQEEVVTLVGIAKPYDEGDLSTALDGAMVPFPEGFLERGITAEYSLKNSASRCFASVLTACEDAKELAQAKAGHLAKRGLEVLVQGGSYYEPSSGLLPNAREHKATKSDTDPAEFDRHVDDMAARGAKIDTYLCEFHHNISTEKNTYEVEDVIGQVNTLINKQVIAHPFTVAIDATIGQTGDDAIRAFLAAFQQHIKAGMFSVVIYRSCQKFEQLGGDMFNGGMMCVITGEDTDAHAPLQRALDNGNEPPLDENFQGLVHLNRAASEDLDAYRAAIAGNVRKLTDAAAAPNTAVPAHFLHTPANADQSVVQLAVSHDDATPFLDIRFNVEGETEKAKIYHEVRRAFETMSSAEDDGAMVAVRASFGFQHGNVTPIDSEKLRFNPGLEDDARLALYSQIFKDFNEVMTPIMQDWKAVEDEFGVDWTLEPKYSDLIVPAVRTALLDQSRIADDANRPAGERDMARLELMRIYGAKNPGGVLRLHGALSPDFRDGAEHALEIAHLLETAMEALSGVLKRPAPAGAAPEAAARALTPDEQERNDIGCLESFRVFAKRKDPFGVWDKLRGMSAEFRARPEVQAEIRTTLEQAEGMAAAIRRIRAEGDVKTPRTAPLPDLAESDATNVRYLEEMRVARYRKDPFGVARLVTAMTPAFRDQAGIKEEIAETLREMDELAPQSEIVTRAQRAKAGQAGENAMGRVEETNLALAETEEANQEYLETARRHAERNAYRLVWRQVNAMSPAFRDRPEVEAEIREILKRMEAVAEAEARPNAQAPGDTWVEANRKDKAQLEAMRRAALANDTTAFKTCVRAMTPEFRARPEIKLEIEMLVATLKRRLEAQRQDDVA
ncbi:MAG: hypothetical protein AAGG09_11285 [Pseudomonadota bacterium]